MQKLDHMYFKCAFHMFYSMTEFCIVSQITVPLSQFRKLLEMTIDCLKLKYNRIDKQRIAFNELTFPNAATGNSFCD